MSAWMITDDHADFIATAYLRLIDPAADPQAIGQALLMENHASLAARYGDNDFSQGEAYRFREWPGDLDARWINKQAACADYQCCEHAGWPASESCARLAALIAATGGRIKWPQSAPWGIDFSHRRAAMAGQRQTGFCWQRDDNRQFRALLIEPETREVFEVWQRPGLAALYATLGCRTVDFVAIGRGSNGASIDLVIDDEGALQSGQSCFRLGEAQFTGPALIVGSRDGETVGTGLALSDVHRQLQWCAPNTDYTPATPIVVTFTDWSTAQALTRQPRLI